MLSFQKLLLIFCLAIVVSADELKMVLEVFRHGARTAVANYWDYNKYWDHGELTPVGMRQHYLLGKILRKKYIEDLKFLSPEYNYTEY